MPKGEVVAVPMSVPFALKSTLAICMGSVTVALNATVPDRRARGYGQGDHRGSIEHRRRGTQIDAAVQAVGFVVGAGRKEQGVVRLVVCVIAESDAPEPRSRNRRIAGVADGAERCAGGRVIGIDLAVAEITDQQRIAERAEIRRRERNSPRRIQCPGRDRVV